MTKKKQGGGQQFLSPGQYLRQKARTLESGKCYITEDTDKLSPLQKVDSAINVA